MLASAVILEIRDMSGSARRDDGDERREPGTTGERDGMVMLGRSWRGGFVGVCWCSIFCRVVIGRQNAIGEIRRE